VDGCAEIRAVVVNSHATGQLGHGEGLEEHSKIGTKTIAGYSAEGYRTETADGNAEIWVAHDARLAVGNMFAANSNLKQMKGRVPDDYPQGMLIQMNAVNTKTGETVT
jgi:hypothetical protein